MKIFAIADLHLSFKDYVDQSNIDGAEVLKPMDVFGEKWDNHHVKIYGNWIKAIGDEDIVLIPGDISWALKLEEAKYDLAFLDILPGKKILGKGNHDYWWQSQKRIREMLSDKTEILYNNSIALYDNLVLCGSRGWISPNETTFDDHDEKLYKRELIRLENSLNKAPKGRDIIVMLHFPPVNNKHEKNELIELMESYPVKHCIYGHLHDYSIAFRIEGVKWEIDFNLVSCDYLNFKPKQLFNK